MTKKLRKTLATLLAVSMILSTVSISAFAETPEDTTPAPAAEEIKEEKEVETENIDAVLDGTQADTDEIDAVTADAPEGEGEENEPAPLAETPELTDEEEVTAAMLAELENAKFVAVIASRSKSNGILTKVVGTVDGDYNAKLFVPGTAVSASNATIGVGMANVASMGITEPRTHAMKLLTGIEMDDIVLGDFLTGMFKVLDGVKVVANITNPYEEAYEVTYNFAADTFVDDTFGGAFSKTTVTGTPADVAATRAAWAAMMENFTFDTQAADSKIVIANGSYFQFNGEKLCFEEDYKGDLVLDNLATLDPEAIKAAVRVIDVEDSSLEFVLKAGTTLAVSSSIATLDRDVKVTVKGLTFTEDEKLLSGLREMVNDPDAGMKGVIGYLAYYVMVPVLQKLDTQKNITVDVTFSEDYDVEKAVRRELNKGNKFVGIVASTLTTGDTTQVVGTVNSGYKATLTIPNANVNPNSLYLGVGMKGVASLGGGQRVHGLGEIKLLGEGNDMDLPLFQIWDSVFGGETGKSNLSNFTGATVNATIKAPVDGETSEKSVTYTLSSAVLTEDSAAKVITATPGAGVADAWHNMVNEDNFTIAPNADNDSKIVIASGSWLQIGNKKLQFAEGKGDISLLSTTGADTVESILDKVELVDTEDDALSFYLTKGTELAVSSSSAKLARDVKVTVTGVSASDFEMVEGENFLVTLQKAVHDLGSAQPEGETPEEIAAAQKQMMVGVIIQLATLLDKSVGAVNGKTVGVEIEFVCVEHEYEVTFTRGDNNTATYTAVCKHCGETLTGDADVAVTTSGRTTTWTPSVVINGTTYTGESWSYTAPRPTTPDDEELGEGDTPLADRPWMFEDVFENDWYYNAVRNMFNLGVIGGVSATQFAPSMNADRGTVAQILYRVVGKPAVTGEALKDVKANAWYRDASIWACAEGVFEGYSNGNFGGDDVITREQLVTVLYRYAQKKGFAVTERSDLSGFRDADKVSGWSAEAMRWAVGAGILTGRSKTTLAPQSNTTRGELTIILNRFVEKFPGIVPANGVAE